MTDSLIIITGSNRGIGKAIAAALARDGKSILLACRNPVAAFETVREIRASSENENVETLPLDLASFASIVAFVDSVRKKGMPVAALINNAGILSPKYQQTVDGYECILGTNYLGTVLLTELLLPQIQKKTGRIICTSSLMYRFGKLDSDIFRKGKKDFNRFRSYADSKLALLLFSLSLAERLRPDGITVNSVDPGIVNTDILKMHNRLDPLTDAIFRPFIKTPEKGASMIVRLAMKEDAPELTGKYFVGQRERALSAKYLQYPFSGMLAELTDTILDLPSIRA